jgi:hypothetical protein
LSSAKEKRKKEKNVKRKKRKEKKRGERRSTYQSCGSQIFEFKSTMKDLGMKLREVIEDYRTLVFSNFQKKRICFVRVMSF